MFFWSSVKVTSFLQTWRSLPLWAISVAAALFITSPANSEPADSLLAPALFPNPEVTYIWPTNASDYMSATFGETRSAHFHSAIDIGTWGREGFDVYAARNGQLFRASVSPVGYGNAVYLRHEDGSFTQYAHLQDFAPEIRVLVDSLRFKDYRMSVDAFFTDNEVHFRQGDVIGRTGATGIGPPHLHFEVRSPENYAVNPKLAGIHIPDSVPPVFSSLAVIPFGSDALVQGSKEIHTVRASRTGRQFSFGDVNASGQVALAVNVSDRSDHGRNVYAVYELEMEVNGELFFRARADSFPMADSRQMLLDRVYPLLLQRRGGFQRLHILPANTLPFYDRDLGTGIINLPPGSHQVTIRAYDFYRNMSEATVNLRITETEDGPQPRASYHFKPVPAQPAPLRADGKTRNPEVLFRWNNRWLSPNQNLENIHIQFRGDGFTPGQSFSSLDAHTGVPLSGDRVEIYTRDAEPVILNRILPGRQTTLNFPAGRFSLRFNADTVFDTTYVHAERFSRGGRDFIRLSPETEPLRRPVIVEAILPDSLAGDSRTGLYFVDESRDRSSYMSSEVDGNILRARAEGFGLYEIRRDTTAPEISRPRIWQRRSDSRWFVSVDVRDLDSGSGIDHNRTNFTVNGVRGIGELDPFGNVMHYHHPEFSPVQGENHISVTVYDQAGNSRTEEFVLSR